MFGLAGHSQPASSVPASGNTDADLSIFPGAATVQGRLRLGKTDLLVEGRVQGSVTTEGTLYVAKGGVVCGNIAARRLRLAPGSRVEGIVRANELWVGGEMIADVMALQSLCLLKTARIDGTVLVGDEARFEVNLGAVVNASVERVEEALAASAAQDNGEPPDAASIASWAAEVSVSVEAPEGQSAPSPADAPAVPEAPTEEAPDDPSSPLPASDDPGEDRLEPSPEEAAADETDEEEDDPSIEEKNYGFEW
jgi:cytoskeletal protein CcmA (bactofilin family)